MSVPADREAALVTFLVTASGMSFLGLSAAFWGLIFGLVTHLLLSWRSPGLAQACRPAVQGTGPRRVPLTDSLTT